MTSKEELKIVSYHKQHTLSEMEEANSSLNYKIN